MKLNYYQFPENTEENVLREYGCNKSDLVLGGISVTSVKKLLKDFGGNGWTEHCERDGGVFEVTDITLKGNNSKFKYNHHL